MANIVINKNRVTGEVEYPVTVTDAIYCSDGQSLKEHYATKQYADEAAADILNSSPEQLQVINAIGERLGDDEDLANAITQQIANSKKEVFIELWNTACGAYGKYNSESGFFELNGLTDITFDQAKLIFLYANLDIGSFLDYKFYNCPCRTLFPVRVDVRKSMTYFMSGPANKLEVVQFYSNNSEGIIYPTDLSWFFDGVKTIQKIGGIIDLSNCSYIQNSFRKCANLEEIRFKNLKLNLSFADSPNISYDSITYLISKASNSSTITITVHPDVYAKLNDVYNEQWHALLKDANSRQISFATV